MKWKRTQRDAAPADSVAAATAMPTAGPGTGYDCARCGDVITASQESRRTATGDWVHLAC